MEQCLLKLPRRLVGKVYEIQEKYYVNKEKLDLFDIIIVKAEEAVKAGLITEVFEGRTRKIWSFV